MKTGFKQKAKVGVAGSFFNQLMSNNSTIPVVGEGATELHYSDRSPYQVIEVSEDCRTVKIERYDAKWDATKEGGMGHQNWILAPTGQFRTIVYRNGAWRTKCSKIVWTEEFQKEYDSCQTREERQLLLADISDKETGDFIVVEGKTRIKYSYPVTRIIFGKMQYHYDWEF